MDQPTVAEIAAGLRALADFLDAHPELPAPIYLTDTSVWFPHGEEIPALIRAALASGVEVVKHDSVAQRNIELRFGAVGAMALVNKSEVCERVVVGTEVVQVPDPAYIPPLIETTVEKTEWRCRPLLAPAES